MLNLFSNTNNNLSFGVNLRSPKLRFRQDEFFIRIRGYGRDTSWASMVKKTADESVILIREHKDFEDVLKFITDGIIAANQIPIDIWKRQHTGILRTKRKGWKHGSSWDGFMLTTPYGNKGLKKYRTYQARLDNILRHPINNPFPELQLTRPESDKNETFLKHAHKKFINNAFVHIERIYNFLMETYIKHEVQQKDLCHVNNSIAQIRWLLAHATPWERGSDAISNVFMKALYKAIGIKTSRPAHGISFDLEAYCTNLSDYKKNFTSYFEKPPIIIE